MEEVGVLKEEICPYVHILMVSCQSAFTSDTDPHNIKNILSPSFPFASCAAVWITRYSTFLCLVFMKLSSSFCLAVSFLCSFLIRSTLSRAWVARKLSVFRDWVSRPSHRLQPSLSMPWHRLQRKKNTRACTHAHTHVRGHTNTHMHTHPDLASFPHNFGLLVCLLAHPL